MSITGKGSLSLRKKDVKEQKNLAIGFKKLTFAHKATLGDTGINLSSLVVPTEMSSLGFTNPSSGELLAAQLLFYRKNLTLVSSVKGPLMDFLSYDVTSSNRINFSGFTAEDGEIFIGTVDYNARNGVNLVDAAPLVSTGELAVAATDFNVGQMFEIGKYSTQQVGAVIVYRNGVQQFRNTGNSSVVLDANYYEVNNGSGTGQVIRFNVAPVGNPDNILVVSNGLLAYNPDGSALQQIETLAGQIDAMVPTLASLAGVPETNFQAAPSNVDLKSFGDTVLGILSVNIPYMTDWVAYTPTMTGSNIAGQAFKWRRVGSSMEIIGSFKFTGAPGGIYGFSLPSGTFIDTTAISYGYGNGPGYERVGDVTLNPAAGGTWIGQVTRDGTSTTNLAFGGPNGQVVGWNNTVPVTIVNNDAVMVSGVVVPISGWSATQTIKQYLGL